MIEIAATLFQWTIFFLVLGLAMKYLKERIDTKTPKEDLLSDEEVEERTKEEFPWWYEVYFVLLVLLMVGAALALVLLSAWLVTSYPALIIEREDYIALSTNPSAMYLLLLVFFPGIVAGGMLMGYLSVLSPRMARYMEKKQLKSWGMRLKAKNKSTNRIYTLITAISFFLILPFLVLAADNYYYVDEKAFHYNSFWGFDETSIPLEKMEKVSAGIWLSNGGDMNWEYILVFKDGRRFDMKEANRSDLKSLDSLLIQKGIPIEYTKKDEEAFDKEYSLELEALFDQVFINRPQ